jgi:hypothetical protein
VLDFVSLSGLILGNRVDLSLLGSGMRNEQGTQHREVQPSRCRLLLQQIKQALDLAMVILDQLDDIGSGHGCSSSSTGVSPIAISILVETARLGLRRQPTRLVSVSAGYSLLKR